MSNNKTLNAFMTETIEKMERPRIFSSIPSAEKLTQMKRNMMTDATEDCFRLYQAQPMFPDQVKQLKDRFAHAQVMDGCTKNYWKRIKQEVDYNTTHFNYYSIATKNGKYGEDPPYKKQKADK